MRQKVLLFCMVSGKIGSALEGEQLLTVGIDEAGYAPLAGPLVVAAVALNSDPETTERILAQAPHPITDSKKVYGGNIRNLEPVVLGLLDEPPEKASVLLEVFCDPPPDPPFYWHDFSLPLGGDVEPLNLGVRVNAEIITAAELNHRLNKFSSKADLLWDAVARRIEWAQTLHPSPTIICDRLGSRKDYSRLLRERFALAVPLHHSNSHWTYRLANSTITFCTDGDASHRIVGLASMVAKYLRELLMHALNRWLLDKGLVERPITGYADRPLVRQIAEKLKTHNISAETFLRKL